MTTTTEHTTTRTRTVDLPSALGELAGATAVWLGDGLVNEEGETNGQLEGSVEVRFATVLGEAGWAVTMESPTATVWIDDMLAPIHQMQALLDALRAHCLSQPALLR